MNKLTAGPARLAFRILAAHHPLKGAMFDQRCYELAEHFLRDGETRATESLKRELAQIIQDAIEFELSQGER